MAQHILLFLTRCSAWLTVQLMVHSQTTPPHNMLLYLIWLFNYKPLANCKSSGSWLEPQLRVFSAKASSKASSRGFPSRAACGAWDTPEPSSRRFPALTDAPLCWCRLRWWWGRAWSVGQRFRALTFLSPSLSLVTFPRLMRLLLALKAVRIAVRLTWSWLRNICPNSSVQRLRVRFNWNVTLLLNITYRLSSAAHSKRYWNR